eukprot:8931090-Ditylum_brightwellii.AAC.1
MGLQSAPSETVAAMRQRFRASAVNNSSLCVTDSTDDVSDVTRASSVGGSARKKPAPSLQTKLQDTYGGTLNQEGADVIIMTEVRAMVSRGKALSRLLDPYVQAGLIQRHPAISKFLPRNTETIFDKYVVKVDEESKAELVTFLKNIPGHVNVAMDGVTVNGKQK